MLMIYAEVAVNTTVHQTYHYQIPERLNERVQRGSLVRVGFGTAMQPGIVVALHASLPSDLQDITIKPIIDLLHPAPVMTEAHIDIALWMSEVYLTAPGACLWLMLPPGLTGKSSKRVHLIAHDADGNTDTQQRLLDALREHSPQSVDALRAVAGIKTVERVLRDLETLGYIEQEAYLSPPSVRQKTVRTVVCAIPEDEVLTALGRLKRAPKQTRVFAHIARYDYPLDVQDVYDAVDATSADLNALARKGLVQLGERIVYRDSLADTDFVPSQALRLTAEQQAVADVIHQQIAQQAQADVGDYSQRVGFLLHGVTGSGKTEIYLQAIAQVIAQGQQAIFLVPEIALTPQTIRRVAQRFPDQVAVVHGSLSAGERFDTWQRARDGQIQVIVGTRSALFTPLPDVGLVILDEEHDHSYKHAPPFNPPYYHARDVAEQLMRVNGGTLILGSATPDLASYYRAQREQLHYLHMPNRIMGHRQRVEKQAQQRGVRLAYQALSDEAMTIGLPPVMIVDMRDELKAGNRSMFSRDLKQALRDIVARGEQAILFLNRRGQASYVFCRDCGYVVTCDRCDTAMTYHRAGDQMRCHHCNHQQNAPTVCPQCQGTHIRYFGAGTQQVEQAIHDEFPDMRTLRWDRDTADKPDLHAEILARFVRGDADVLIGTQMIAKGLDLPLVTLVGVISADPGLALPDFRASERAFQILMQVAGRAGRGILGGQVIVQTYQPRHPAIVLAADHDYAQFYAEESAARRQLGYPPYRRLGRILVHHTHPIEAERQIKVAARQVKHQIEKQELTDVHLIGPAPCFFARIDRQYRWQLLIRSADPTQVLGAIQGRAGWYIELDPLDIL
ncbi:MAG: primosomal protein N' [Anaerolineae bacterium]